MVVVLFLILWLMASPALASQSCGANLVPVGNGVQIDPTCKKVPDVAINDAYSGVGACSSHQWVDALTRDVAPTCAQPNFTDLAGTIAMSQFASQSANTVLAGPNGSSGTPSFRALVGADLPNPSSTTLGGIESFAAQASKWINSISTLGVPSATQPAFTDISGTASNAQLPAPYGNSTFTQYGVVLGNAGGNLNVTAQGASANILIAQGAANPTWNAVGGDVTMTSGGSFAVVKVNGNTPGGTCSGSQPFVASISSSGVPTCNATTVTPTFGETTLTGGNFPLLMYANNGALNGLVIGNAAATSHWLFYETEGAAGQQGALTWQDQVNGSLAFLQFETGSDAVDFLGGGVRSGSPTGGAKGTGTYNGTAYYVNGTLRLNTDGTVQPLLTTVAGLPTCNAGEKNAHAGVTDADACTFLATVTHTVGALFCPVVCNGANWQGA